VILENTPLATLADALPGLVWAALPGGRMDFVNRRWHDYVGADALPATGAGWQSSVHPDDLPRLREAWHRMAAAEEPVGIELRLRRNDGVFRWFSMSGNAVRDGAGRITRWYGLCTDVEDRRLAEEALRQRDRRDRCDRRDRRDGRDGHDQEEATQRQGGAGKPARPDLHTIIDTIPMTAWSTGADGDCDFVNQRWLDYAGVSLEDVGGWGWGTVVHPDDRPGLLAEWQLCLASGKQMNTEARMRRFDGVYRWFLFLGSPLHDEAGRIVKWYGTNVDIEDRKRADQAIQESERNLNQIINTIPTTAWSTRPDGYCDFLSDRWLDYAGFTAQQAQGWNWSSVIHPDDAPGLIDYWQGQLANGLPVDVEARMRRFDGVYRWFLFRANPLRDAEGRIVKWYGTNVDIDDRKKADDALRASEHDLRLIINTIPMLAWSTRPDGFCDFVNRRWIEFTGISSQQAEGWNWEAAIHPDDVDGLVNRWRGALASGEALDSEARMRRFDGEYRWFLFRGNPLYDDAGTLVSWYGTNVDIEDRKRAEEQLLRSELLLAEGQRVSQTGSFYWRVETDDIRGSDELHRILRLPKGTPLTMARFRARVHAEDLPSLGDLIALARSGAAELLCELRLTLPDSAFRFVRFAASRNRDREEQLDYVGAIQDVTQRHRSEQALAQVSSELAYMTRVASMGVLTASIAHEVNQPLTGIIANGSTCLRMLSADPPNVEGALETAKRTIRDSNRAADVITRLRALFARSNTAVEAVDLNEATREVVALSMNELQRNRVTLRIELAESLEPVAGDRIQLQQVILNLLMNACAAMNTVDDRPRLLSVRTERDPERGIRLSVQDNGVGIGAERIERLFDPFYTTKCNGLGIGLSVSRTIVESHGGHLWGASNAGAGVTFAFTIPGRRPA
jgi:PAS domain S-box-containing protein